MYLLEQKKLYSKVVELVATYTQLIIETFDNFTELDVITSISEACILGRRPYTRPKFS